MTGGVRRVRAVFLTGLGASLVLKMALLEPVVFPLGVHAVVLAAALLPLALLLRGLGVVLIAGACGVAHLLHGGAVVEAMVAALSVGAATGAAYPLVARDARIGRWLAAGWTLTAILTVGMATGSALFLGRAFGLTFAEVLVRVWLPVNGLGVPLALLVIRSAGPYLPAPAAWPWRT